MCWKLCSSLPLERRECARPAMEANNLKENTVEHERSPVTESAMCLQFIIHLWNANTLLICLKWRDLHLLHELETHIVHEYTFVSIYIAHKLSNFSKLLRCLYREDMQKNSHWAQNISWLVSSRMVKLEFVSFMKLFELKSTTKHKHWLAWLQSCLVEFLVLLFICLEVSQ